MAIDTTEVQAFTYAELLAACKQAIMRILVGPGQSYTINGRAYSKANLGELMEMANKLEEIIAAEAAGEQGGNVLVEYGERV